MIEIIDYLNSIKLWTIADIRDEKIKQTILNQIENDKVNPLMFDINFYKQYKHHYASLGQTNLELLEISKCWKHNLTVIMAVCKFKRAIVKKRKLKC